MNLFAKENRHRVTKGARGEGSIRSVGLTDKTTAYKVSNRIYYIAQGTICNIL